MVDVTGTEVRVLLHSIRELSKAFDEFIGECMDETGKPICPSVQAVAKARGYLPPYCTHAYAKKLDR